MSRRRTNRQSASRPVDELTGDSTVVPAERWKDSRYQSFLQVLAELRPRLHRYCSRMTGSALDGEDILQEALFQAYRSLHRYDENRPMAPWLFRIAHNRCLDFLRQRSNRSRVESESEAVPEPVAPTPPSMNLDVPVALEALIVFLPPKERACLILKDVLGYSLEDAALVVGSTVGGVKAALHRARGKLAAARDLKAGPPAASTEELRILERYVERFNRHDWDGILELTRADARLELLDLYSGPLANAPGYFAHYEAAKVPWRLSVGMVDHQPAALIENREPDVWRLTSVVRLRLDGGRIAEIRDYTHCSWVLGAALSVVETPRGLNALDIRRPSVSSRGPNS